MSKHEEDRFWKKRSRPEKKRLARNPITICKEKLPRPADVVSTSVESSREKLPAALSIKCGGDTSTRGIRPLFGSKLGGLNFDLVQNWTTRACGSKRDSSRTCRDSNGRGVGVQVTRP